MDSNRQRDYSELSIRKPAATTHYRNQYTLTERKLFNIILHNAQEVDYNKPVYSVPIESVRHDLGITKSKNTDWLKDSVKGLVTKAIEWNTLGKDKSLKSKDVGEWGVCTFLSMGSIRGSNLRFSINPHMVGWIKEQRVWSRLHYMVQLKINSQPAIVLYEYMITELSNHTEGGRRVTIGKGEKLDRKVTIKDLRILFGIKPGQYAEYRSFHQHCIKVAVTHINKETDIYITYQSVRAGRKVESLLFTVERKARYQLSLPVPDMQTNNQIKVITADSNHEETREIVDLLSTVDVGSKAAVRIFANHSSDCIRRNVAYTLVEAGKRPIEKISGYALSAIEKDYAETMTKKQAEKIFEKLEQDSTKRKIKAAALAAKENDNRLKKEFVAFQASISSTRLENYSASWNAKKKKLYLESLGGLARDRFDKNGFNDLIVQAGWTGFLKEAVLNEPHEKNFENYKAWKLSELGA